MQRTNFQREKFLPVKITYTQVFNNSHCLHSRYSALVVWVNLGLLSDE